MTGKISHIVITAVAVCLLAFSSVGHAQAIDEEPTALAMTGDALFVRPALFATTIVGSVVYLVSRSPHWAVTQRKPARFWLLARPKPPLFAASVVLAPAGNNSPLNKAVTDP